VAEDLGEAAANRATRPTVDGNEAGAGRGGGGKMPPVADMEQISTEPDFYAQYRISQAIRVGGLVFVSGQAAIDESGVVGAGDFDAQAAQVFRNLAAVLEAGGSGLDRVVKVTIFLTDMANYQKILELRERYFTPPYPADTIVEVSSLALPELQIEIEAVALARG
jgi:2-iminobutanoate/2-iminopropanoate deaminase